MYMYLGHMSIVIPKCEVLMSNHVARRTVHRDAANADNYAGRRTNDCIRLFG